MRTTSFLLFVLIAATIPSLESAESNPGQRTGAAQIRRAPLLGLRSVEVVVSVGMFPEGQRIPLQGILKNRSEAVLADAGIVIGRSSDTEDPSDHGTVFVQVSPVPNFDDPPTMKALRIEVALLATMVNPRTAKPVILAIWTDSSVIPMEPLPIKETESQVRKLAIDLIAARPAGAE